MVRTLFMVLIAAQLLAGCTTVTEQPPPGSQAAKEFATQKEGVCCYVGMKKLPDEAAAKAAQYPDLSGQLADANRNLANKERENADLKRQLDALKARSMPPDLSGQLAAKESENADLARQLAAMKEARDRPASELSKTLAEKGSVTLHGIHFDFGKATVKPQSAKDLAAIGQALMNDPSLKLEIQGHTDNVGGDASNLQLSKRRAAAVKEYVVKYFVIEPDRLTTTGFGESKPVADNKTAEGRALNRRVELIKK